MNEDVCVIIHTCDKYSFILDEFFNHFEQHFPYNNFKIYLTTETLSYSKPYLENIVTGKDSWSNRFLNILNQIKYPYFLYLQEDMLLLHVDSDTVNKACILKSINKNIKILKLGTFHDFKLQRIDLVLNNYPLYLQSGGDYVMSHQPPAIFDKEFFIDTLYREHDVWTHEVEVTKEINNNMYGNIDVICIGNIYYPTNKSEIITSHHAIRKGTYVPIR